MQVTDYGTNGYINRYNIYCCRYDFMCGISRLHNHEWLMLKLQCGNSVPIKHNPGKGKQNSMLVYYSSFSICRFNCPGRNCFTIMLFPIKLRLCLQNLKSCFIQVLLFYFFFVSSGLIYLCIIDHSLGLIL